MNCGGRIGSGVLVKWVVMANVAMTTTIASQNQRKTFRKRLRNLTPPNQFSERFEMLSALHFRRPRVDIADAADGLDSLGVARAVAELLAEVTDVHVDAAVEDRQLAPEHRAHEVFALDDESGRAQELDENLVLDVRQLRRLAAAPDLTRPRIDLHVADANARGCACLGRLSGGFGPRGARAAEDGLNAGDQLARVEGFGKIVVGADLQSDNAVNIVAAGREHHDVYVRAFGSESAQHLEAVHARHHHVQHDERVLARKRAFEPRGAPVRDLNPITLFAEQLSDQLTQLSVVVNNKHVFHQQSPRTFYPKPRPRVRKEVSDIVDKTLLAVDRL